MLSSLPLSHPSLLCHTWSFLLIPLGPRRHFSLWLWLRSWRCPGPFVFLRWTELLSRNFEGRCWMTFLLVCPRLCGLLGCGIYLSKSETVLGKQVVGTPADLFTTSLQSDFLLWWFQMKFHRYSWVSTLNQLCQNFQKLKLMWIFYK